MHIAYLLTPPGIPVGGPSGSSRHVSSLIRAFVELGHRVTLAAAHRYDGLEAPLPAHLQIASPETPPWWVRGRPAVERWQARALAADTLRRLREDPPDFLYERYALFSDAGAWLRGRLRVPWLLEVNAPLRLERARYEGLRADRRARRAERAILARADRLLAVSGPLARYLVEDVRVPAERVVVVPNGVEPRIFRPVDRSAALAARLGLASGPVIGFSGSLKPWHGLERWLEVVARVAARLPAVQGLVVGDGPGLEQMRALATRLGIAGRVRFAGQVAPDEVVDHLVLMDLLLAPYPRIDPFYFCPLKVDEALAAGVPVVTTAQGDLPARVAGAGRAVDPGDLEALADAVAGALEDPAQRARWAAAAPAKVTGRGWREVAARVVALAGG